MSHWLSQICAIALAQRYRKIDLPPSTRPSSEQPPCLSATIHLIDYNATRLEERTLPPHAIESVLRCKDRPTVTWIDVVGLSDSPSISSLMPRPLSDPNPLLLQEGSAYLCIPCPRLIFNATTGSIEIEPIQLILGKGFVLTIRERPSQAFASIQSRLRQPISPIRQRDASYLAYALIDTLIDHYFEVLETLGERTNQLKASVLEQVNRPVQDRLAALQREIIAVRRVAGSLRNVFAELQRFEIPLIAPDSHLFWRSIYHRITQVIEIAELLGGLLATLMDLSLSQLRYRMHETMKVLTVIGLLFIPLILMTGVQGLPLQDMFALHGRYDYPAVMALMIVLVVGMLYGFRRKWL
ncbi:CorA family divalent cation transporter [Rhodothermus profundi]|uniref:Magnesium transporter n=1 Tax=Rhodothermus profundi TaxID=633813 RepID=A0A1M6PEN7_9BACT|nr:CorA family divalent cation transporter [Rhodothermus profundi]SHK06396.1 magnesium transporter [Rhodothermus profundi]